MTLAQEGSDCFVMTLSPFTRPRGPATSAASGAMGTPQRPLEGTYYSYALVLSLPSTQIYRSPTSTSHCWCGAVRQGAAELRRPRAQRARAQDAGAGGGSSSGCAWRP